MARNDSLDAKKPLPVGPVRLVWEDVAILAIIWIPSVIEKDFSSPLVLPILFVSAYLLPLAPTLIGTGCWLSGFAILYGLGASVYLHKDVLTVAELTAALFLIGQIGLWRSLGRFPWEVEWLNRVNAAMKLQMTKDVGRLQENISGWPFDSLGPKAGESETKLWSPRTVILMSILIGWWLAAAASLFSNPRERLPLFAGAAFYGTGFASFAGSRSTSTALRRRSTSGEGFARFDGSSPDLTRCSSRPPWSRFPAGSCRSNWPDWVCLTTLRSRSA